MVSRCVCQSAPVRALVVPVCCERGLYSKKSFPACCKIRSRSLSEVCNQLSCVQFPAVEQCPLEIVALVVLNEVLLLGRQRHVHVYAACGKRVTGAVSHCSGRATGRGWME